MKKEYKELFNQIKPDDILVDSIFESTEKKKGKSITKSVLACAMCLAVIIAGSGFAYNSFQSSALLHTDDGTSQNSANRLGSTIIAYASDNTEPTVFKADIVTKLQYKITCTDTRNMSEDEIESLIEKIHEKQDIAIRDTACFQFLTATCEGLDNAIVSIIAADYFDINIDNPNDVKAITVTNESEYGEAEITSKDYLYDEDGNMKEQSLIDDDEMGELMRKTHIRGHKVTLEGERYAKCKALKENNGNCFEITWKMSQALYDALNENPNMDLSEISDIMTFSVEYKDGTVESAELYIHFDSDGNMYATMK